MEYQNCDWMVTEKDEGFLYFKLYLNAEFQENQMEVGRLDHEG